MLEEFKKFALRGNVIDLAVGIIMGAAFTAIVDSMVKDVLMPPLGLAIGGIDFTNIFLTLKGGSYPTLEAAQKAGAVTINVGVFLNAIVKFVIVAFAVFILVKQINNLIQFTQRKEAAEKAAEPPPPPRQEVLLEEIRDLLARR
ncbi:MAG: large conductance mechanosensitive channel protein MscL [Alphaproteobacteria bacterium]|nr:large conductance mechanosensitive channel protein MscL [Alphaproteobacteria bacterium]